MGGDSILLTFKALTGESLTEIRADSSWTIQSIASRLAESVPPPAGKIYRLVLGVDPLPAGDALRAHVASESAELIACADSDDSSDASSASSVKARKRKEDGKAKSKKAKKKPKKKDSKNKGKKEKKKTKNKCKSSSSSSSKAKKKKQKKLEDDVVLDSKELATKNAWLAERIGQLRQIRPPLTSEQCLVRAQKEWAERKESGPAKEWLDRSYEDAECKVQEAMSHWPPMVHEAMRQAEAEAKAAGKSAAEVQAEVDKAGAFALKVAKDTGLYKEPEDLDDPSKVPLFFQKRPGLEKAIARLKRDD